MAGSVSADAIGASGIEVDPVRLMDYPDSTEEIPIVDIAPFLAGGAGGREAVADRLREVTETVGFFCLKGHGIPQDLIARVFEQSRRFHAQPLEAKRAVGCVNNQSLRSGYRHMATNPHSRSNANLISDTKPNLHELFGINLERGAPPGVAMNVWPKDLPGFRETLLEYHSRIEDLGRKFLVLWATSLNLPLDYFDKFFVTPHLTMQLLHYPPQKEVGNRQYGIAPHTDNSLMTFLAQSEVPGLAVRMPSGHWRVVDPIPGTLLVNTGNLMVRWTNDQYLSTKHRVINTTTEDRYSIPVFFGPSLDALIECLPTCCGPDRPARYEPITYFDLRRWYYDYED